ncbi:hypothetical protein [Flavobacterium hibernum]|uniref:Lipoprotein n=1 Tax=Flavobacterium hibernum TaxID=37752 RepID=A0A0D0EF97_9FLAO|nr:hypothetical protein [Flavobacterium hibernum]KIO53724.1 hypothetical protein IW18_05090 [Flavobacterium hibernum]OXA90669.1 hypothetical protein B0A73_02750 [Flavobacterium hibernum]STO14951.1 Uncharacterised protein [Flavobacterium hibernum]
MKNTIILLFVFLGFLAGCQKTKQEPSKVKISEKKETACLPHLYNDPKLEKEKILIYAEEGVDSLIISRNELNKIEKLFPVFKSEFHSNPEESYASTSWQYYINEDGEKEDLTFSSEAGEDSFCLLYSYYLKQKNGEKKFKTERETLVQLYRAVNGLYEGLNYGGTYFGHQHKRLNASVEYSIYQLAKGKEYFDKKYNFQKQKDLYIKSLMQYVSDEESQNPYNQEDSRDSKEKGSKRAKQLQEKINVLQKLITNYFYLNQVQNFEITYYR